MRPVGGADCGEAGKATGAAAEPRKADGHQRAGFGHLVQIGEIFQAPAAGGQPQIVHRIRACQAALVERGGIDADPVDLAFGHQEFGGVEVKARHFSPFGHPEDSVGKKKFKNLQRAADEFLFLNPGHKWIQYSILSITLFSDKDPEFFLLEDVFL